VKNQETIRKTTGNDFNDPDPVDRHRQACQAPAEPPDFGGGNRAGHHHDQALASKVLKLVNSAFYGFPGKIGTITHAVVILGFSTVKNIVLTASIFDAFSNRKNSRSEFSMENFWMHSIACGAASQTIAKHIGFKEKEECFIAG